ncbi:hypothetical protein FB451DRAFT_1185178 [Mycena latifolia]|nr:hypothetical protein FB451DRAFT_1185178 [Mycena latifolia]
MLRKSVAIVRPEGLERPPARPRKDEASAAAHDVTAPVSDIDDGDVRGGDNGGGGGGGGRRRGGEQEASSHSYFREQNVGAATKIILIEQSQEEPARRTKRVEAGRVPGSHTSDHRRVSSAQRALARCPEDDGLTPEVQRGQTTESGPTQPGRHKPLKSEMEINEATYDEARNPSATKSLPDQPLGGGGADDLARNTEKPMFDQSSVKCLGCKAGVTCHIGEASKRAY